ncbi:dUMP phosphatase [Maioricimonas rarisocia]|uniref:dUMP phosphatase n=1 Tax=Maioricimonas rarisocia TaxID=2528026 RepID=A0A517Z9Z8_9PLAN|nr:HAD family hydrolase [Maioricimonas rarisocia]QDU39317.1 dUMP phosphatase [Maioricimonas rarisocia]
MSEPETPRSPRWLAFDAVGTVIFAEPAVPRAYFEIGRRHGSRLSLDEVKQRFRAAFADRTEDTATAVSVHATSEDGERQFWQRVVRHVLPDVTSEAACFDELYEYFARPEHWRCFPDVEATLRTLRARGYRIALASNFDARLRRVCAGLPELAPVERLVISSEVGWRKPHTGFFEALCRSLECERDGVLLIGDDHVNDVLGAQTAGIDVVRVERSGTTPEIPGSRPHPVVQSLAELPKLLESMQP